MLGHDVKLLMAVPDFVLDLMKFGSKFKGSRLRRPPRLYVKALALKEAWEVLRLYVSGVIIFLKMSDKTRVTEIEGVCNTTLLLLPF
jgi:hypothetical protein